MKVPDYIASPFLEKSLRAICNKDKIKNDKTVIVKLRMRENGILSLKILFPTNHKHAISIRATAYRFMENYGRVRIHKHDKETNRKNNTIITLEATANEYLYASHSRKIFNGIDWEWTRDAKKLPNQK